MFGGQFVEYVIKPVIAFFTFIVNFFSNFFENITNWFNLHRLIFDPIASDLGQGSDYFPYFVVPFLLLSLSVLLIKFLLDLL